MKLEKAQDKIVFSDKTFTKRVIFSEEKVLNFMLNMQPGQEIPPHKHENSDLILYVVSGGGELNVDDKIQNITTGDVIYCIGEETFSLKNNTSTNFTAFVVIAPRPSLQAYAAEIGK